MKNLKQMFHTTIITAASLLMFIPASGYADEIDLPCCTDLGCPTEVISPGEPEIIQSATFKGVLVPSENGGVLLTKFLGDVDYNDWKRALFKNSSIDRKTRSDMLKTSRSATVYARCSGSTEITNLVKEKNLVCLEGDGIILDQEKPVCEDPETGPHGVVDISKISRRDLEELGELVKRLEMRRNRIVDLNSEHRENQRKIREYDLSIERLEDQFFGRGGGQQDSLLDKGGLLDTFKAGMLLGFGSKLSLGF